MDLPAPHQTQPLLPGYDNLILNDVAAALARESGLPHRLTLRYLVALMSPDTPEQDLLFLHRFPDIQQLHSLLQRRHAAPMIH